MLNRFLSRFEEKFGKFAVKNLMTIILIGMIVIYAFDFLTRNNPDMHDSVSSLFQFDLERIQAGQVWRLITFLFVPQIMSLLPALFMFYILWLLGTGLEEQWGSFKFNVFYLVGWLETAIAGCITGYAVNTYLHLSLFFAFALLYPDYSIDLIFSIPIRMKWIGILDAISCCALFLISDWNARFLMLICACNLLLFFMEDIILDFKQIGRRIRLKRMNKRGR